MHHLHLLRYQSITRSPLEVRPPCHHPRGGLLRHRDLSPAPARGGIEHRGDGARAVFLHRCGGRTTAWSTSPARRPRASTSRCTRCESRDRRPLTRNPCCTHRASLSLSASAATPQAAQGPARTVSEGGRSGFAAYPSTLWTGVYTEREWTWWAHTGRKQHRSGRWV